MSPPFVRDLVENAQAHPEETLLTQDVARFVTCKSGVEVAIASLLLLLIAPLILLLVVLVRATAPGPAIFKQVRLGRGGRPYHLYKIRTMENDCERLTGPRWSTAKDPRVTRIGLFLRRSHLDELPQLWNVVRREMSLVGPRPERPEFVVELERAIPGYRKRLAINPGITGLAQIQLPPDNDLDDVRRKVACDLCYLERMGPTMDLKILMGTAMNVIGLPFDLTRQVLGLPGVAEADLPNNPRTSSEPRPITQLHST